jgi:periplasmic divalent cation tolerance protein
MDAVLVTFVVDDRAVAAGLATAAVERRLAACAQLTGPVTSTYRWKGRVETATEWQVQLKTAADRVDELVAHVTAGHPYDVPEVLVTAVLGGNPAYLEWVVAETRVQLPPRAL